MGYFKTGVDLEYLRMAFIASSKHLGTLKEAFERQVTKRQFSLVPRYWALEKTPPTFYGTLFKDVYTIIGHSRFYHKICKVHPNPE